MPTSNLWTRHGFTLVELMVVTLIFGVFAGAVYSLYIAHYKTAVTREDVVDVQQNVRIAMDNLTRDIHKAGFLVTPPFEKSMSNYSTISIQAATTGTPFVAVIDEILPTANFNDKFSVYPSTALNSFTPGVDSVNVIRPSTKSLVSTFSVISSSSVSSHMKVSLPTQSTTPWIGDMLIKSDHYPEMIRYFVDRTDTAQGCDKSPCMKRNLEYFLGTNRHVVSSDVIAQGINSIKFDYIYMDPATNASAVTQNPSALPAPATEALDPLRHIYAMQLTVTGLTSKKSGPSDTQKERVLQSYIKLRNSK